MLDNRAPPIQAREAEERQEDQFDVEVQRLRQETRLWRIANHAQWVAWGIVQAKLPGMRLDSNGHSSGDKEELGSHRTNPEQGIDPPGLEEKEASNELHDRRAEEEGEANDEGFDYLGYAQERAMFFWGDVLQIGLIKEDELPAELRSKIKIVKY